MVLSSSNRKSFALNLHIPLSRSSSASPSSSKDSALSQSDRSLHSFAFSPSRAAFLSPRGPLPPASLHVKQEQPILPIPLTDGLDPSEKMKLLRKTRKLSRILGEVPIPVSVDSPFHATMDFGFLDVREEPSLTSASTSASSAATRSPAEDTLNSLKRSATVSHNRHAQQKEIHRARSLASLRPSLSIPAAAVAIHPSPISPVTFAWPDNYPIPPSPVSPVSQTDECTPDDAHLRRDSIASSRRDSVASSIFPSQRSPEQVLRARAAKLARQLGDNIPPEVLLRASSPQPRSPLTSPSVMSFAETSLTIREPQPRTSSTQRTRGDRRDLKRRLSLDIRAFVRIPEPPVPSPALSDTVKYGDIPAMDGRRSAGREGSAPHMTRPYDTTEPEEGVPVPDVAPPAVEGDSALVSDLDSDSEDGARPLSLEKQRLLNVRRARKMLQVFGNEPPPALFQITNIPANATDEGISVALSIAHRRDDSRATATSVPSSTLSVPDTRHGQRDSVGTASSADNLSPLVFADPASVPPSRVHSPHQRPADGDPELIPPLPPLPPSQDTVLEIAPSSPLSVPTVASSSLHSLSAPSAISIPASHSYSTLDQGPLSSPIRSSFQASPPANQTMFLWGPASAPASPPLATASVLSDPLVEVHPADPHFRDRRRRAAKLSRFFGVGLHDIAGMLRGGSSSSAGAAATTGTPASPPLREFKRSGSSDSIPSPVSPQETVPSPTSVRSSRSTRPATSSGIVGDPSVSIAESPRPRKRTLSSGTRSQSVSGRPRRPQTQPSMQPGVERNRSNSQPEGMSQQMHNRAFSTTVEVLAESKGRFAFLDTRRPSKVKELNMQDVVRELRKIK